MQKLAAHPWLLAAILCPLSYAMVAILGQGRFRSEFLGISFAIGIVGASLLLLNRFATRRFWMRWSGAFCLNWLFAAYVVSYFAL